MERRRHRRELITLPCFLELASGHSFQGHTQDIGFGGALMRGHGFAHKTRGAKVGEVGLFTLHFKKHGKNASLRLRCHVAHVRPYGVGLQTSFEDLPEADQLTLESLLASGGNIK